jgi:NAD(P)-dependent dehydrogenase (short-subunit alcohol dehydrogenase family)
LSDLKMRLKGKRALITGASRGLGREVAVRYALEGAAALSLVARDARALDEVKMKVGKVAPETDVVAVPADLSRASDVERVVAVTLGSFDGRLDVLVNNASTIGPTPMPLLVDYPLRDLRRVLDTNLIAPFLLIQKFLPALIDSHGSVVNVTSDAGNHGYPGWGAYGISKFGVEGMSKTWAAELADVGVRVNLVDPGDMDTSMHRAAEPDGDPSRWARPEAVTEVFVHLASDESRAVSGKRFHAQSKEWMAGHRAGGWRPGAGQRRAPVAGADDRHG